MSHLRRTLSVIGLLAFWTLTGTVSAIGFGFVYGIVVLSIVFGNPLFWFGGLALGPLAGAIGGPVFGAVYGAVSVWRGRAEKRSRAVLLAGTLGGLIFAIVGIGFCAWEASERSYEPTTTMRPLPPPNAGQVVDRGDRVSYSRGTIQATPDGGRVIEQHERTSDAGRSAKSVSTTLGVMALGGFLYGALFSAMVGSGRRMRHSELQNTEDTELGLSWTLCDLRAALFQRKPTEIIVRHKLRMSSSKENLP